jgi:hypothetical protein
VSTVVTPMGLKISGAVCSQPVFTTVTVPALTYDPSQMPTSQPTVIILSATTGAGEHHFIYTNFIGIFSVIILVGVLRFHTIFTILPIRDRKLSHLYDILVVLNDEQEAIVEKIPHDDIFFFRSTEHSKGVTSNNFWMMNVAADPLERRFEVQFLDRYDLLGFGDVNSDKLTHRVRGNKLYTKEVYLHEARMQIGMIINVREAGSLDPPVQRKVPKTPQPQSPDDLRVPIPVSAPGSRTAPVPIPTLPFESDFYSLETHMEPDSHSEPTRRSSASARATLGTLDYADSSLSPRNVSSRSRPSRRHIGKSVRSPVEAPGTSQWETAFNAQFEGSDNMTNSATAALKDDSDADKDSNDSLSIDLLFSDDGFVTRSVDGSSSARNKRLTNTRIHRRITFQNDGNGTDIIPPRSRKPVRVSPARRNSVSSCGSSASTSSTPLSARGNRPAQGTSLKLEPSVGSDEVLQNLQGAGAGAGEGAGAGAGEEKTREEAEGRPWRNLNP